MKRPKWTKTDRYVVKKRLKLRETWRDRARKRQQKGIVAWQSRRDYQSIR